MFEDRLQTDRFFARVKAFDIACPACGEVHTAGEGTRTRKFWRPRESRFQCRKCGLTFVLGILAWPVRGGVKPSDHRPNRRESLALRQLVGGFWMHRKINENQNYDANVALRTGCTCEMVRSAMFIDEKCPIHGDIKGCNQKDGY